MCGGGTTAQTRTPGAQQFGGGGIWGPGYGNPGGYGAQQYVPGGSGYGKIFSSPKPAAAAPVAAPTPQPQNPGVQPPPAAPTPPRQPQFWGDLEQQWNQFSRNPKDWVGQDMVQAKQNFMNAGGMGGPGTVQGAMGDPGAHLRAPYKPYAAPTPPVQTGQFAGSNPWSQYGFSDLNSYIGGLQNSYG